MFRLLSLLAFGLLAITSRAQEAHELPADSPLTDARQALSEERYAELWRDSAFGIVADPPPQGASPALENPMEGLRLVGLLERNGEPVVLIQRGEGNPVETLDYNHGSAGLDLIEVELGAKLGDTRVMLAGPQGEGWLSFAADATGLPENTSDSVSAPSDNNHQEESSNDDNNRNRGRGRGRGRWSEEQRQQARERVSSELERTQELLQQAQDPTERANLEERVQRLNAFQKRINGD